MATAISAPSGRAFAPFYEDVTGHTANGSILECHFLKLNVATTGNCPFPYADGIFSVLSHGNSR